jgi:hypothetical protein
MGREAGFELELLSFASGTATLPMSYSRPLNNLEQTFFNQAGKETSITQRLKPITGHKRTTDK